MAKKVAKKSTKTKTTKSQIAKAECGNVLCNPLTWLGAAFVLGVIVIISTLFIAGGLRITSHANIDNAKLAVFDDLAESYVRDFDLNENETELYNMTGYGISNEDGVFYLTFTITPYENHEPGVTRYGVMYFWKDEERGTYSHAYSYHDEAYHPEGEYHAVSAN